MVAVGDNLILIRISQSFNNNACFCQSSVSIHVTRAHGFRQLYRVPIVLKHARHLFSWQNNFFVGCTNGKISLKLSQSGKNCLYKHSYSRSALAIHLLVLKISSKHSSVLLKNILKELCVCERHCIWTLTVISVCHLKSIIAVTASTYLIKENK